MTRKILLGVTLIATIVAGSGYFSSWGALSALFGRQVREGNLELLSAAVESLEVQTVDGSLVIKAPPFESSRVESRRDAFGNIYIKIPVSGRDMGAVGWLILLLAVGPLLILVAVPAFKRRERDLFTTAAILCFLGVVLMLGIRLDESVISSWGSLTWNLTNFGSTSGYDLGYPLGPRLSMIGFLVGFIGSALLIRGTQPTKDPEPGAQAGSGPAL